MMGKDKNRKAALECGGPRDGYTEDTPIEQPAIALMGELGWETVNAYHEFDHGGEYTTQAHLQRGGCVGAGHRRTRGGHDIKATACMMKYLTLNLWRK